MADRSSVNLLETATPTSLWPHPCIDQLAECSVMADRSSVNLLETATPTSHWPRPCIDQHTEHSVMADRSSVSLLETATPTSLWPRPCIDQLAERSVMADRSSVNLLETATPTSLWPCLCIDQRAERSVMAVVCQSLRNSHAHVSDHAHVLISVQNAPSWLSSVNLLETAMPTSLWPHPCIDQLAQISVMADRSSVNLLETAQICLALPLSDHAYYVKGSSDQRRV